MTGPTNFVSSVCCVTPSEQYPYGLIIVGSNDCSIYAFSIDSSVLKYKLLGHSGTELHEYHSSFAKVSTNTIDLWHKRLGHVNETDLRFMAQKQMLRGLSLMKGELKACKSRRLSESTKQSHPNIGEIRSEEILELVHSDVWGPAPVTSARGVRYYITFIDDYSRNIWIYIMRKKNMVNRPLVLFTV